jgi:uncharacterized protein (TIGR03435 family)
MSLAQILRLRVHNPADSSDAGTMTRSIALTALVIVSMAFAQDAAFDVATIRPHDPARPGFGMQIVGRRFNSVGAPLSHLIAFAYALHPRQIAGAPGWVETEKFDIVAEVTGVENQANGQAMIERVQKLLADRFGLRFHREKKQMPAYIVTVAKGGARFLNSAGGSAVNPTYGFTGRGSMTVNNATIANFAGWMQRYVLDRPVVDRTGIPGKYTFKLNWKADEFQFRDIAGALPSPADEADRPDLYTAMQQQLGLKLESAKETVDVLVIDRVEKPTDN